MTVVAGDFNSKSGAWGSPIKDARGSLLSDMMTYLNILACNSGNLGTFIRGNSETFTNIIFASSDIANQIRNWRVLDETESLSPHRYITFDMSANLDALPRQQLGKRWSWRRLEQGKLQIFLNEQKM